MLKFDSYIERPAGYGRWRNSRFIYTIDQALAHIHRMPNYLPSQRRCISGAGVYWRWSLELTPPAGRGKMSKCQALAPAL
jgi:hypothetical protein